MRIFFNKHWIWLLIITMAGIGGFFIGRSSKDEVSKIVYKPGKEIHDSVPFEVLNPNHSEIPDQKDLTANNPDLPVKEVIRWLPGKDSIISEVKIREVDTSAIIRQFATVNKYSTTVFDDKKNGKMIVNSTVQYNKLQGLGYDFKPIQKEITIERKRTFTPFVTGSYSTLKQAGVGAGMYIRNIGVGAKIITDIQTGRTGYEGGIYFKF